MSISLAVSYQSQKKVFKVTPSTLLQQIAVDGLEYFKIDPTSKFQLKHRKLVLDLSQPVRFSNLPNNAQLELVLISSAAPSATCKIALSVTGNIALSCNGVFSDQISLKAVLDLFVQEGKLPKNLFDLSPELIYLRASFSTIESMSQVTLASLGLSGQSVRFQLRLHHSSSPPPLVSQEPVVAVKKDESVKKELPAMLSAEEEGTKFKSSESVPMEVEATETTNHSSETIEEEVAEPSPSPSEAMAVLLASNFDATSRGAVLTLMKYLVNLSASPFALKYRSIRLDNKVFAEKVLPAKGAVEFLLSVGFRAVADRLLAFHPPSGDTGEAVDLSLLEQGLAALERAMAELEIPVEERPQRTRRAEPLQTEDKQQQRQEEASFDPFKPLFVRQGPALLALSEEKSLTETQLEQLKRKREELEGKPSEVSRDTRVVLSGLARTRTRDSEPEEKEEGGGGLAKGLLQRYLKSQKEFEEGKPLTTQAYRDLLRLQQEKVYRETVIRIRFPDKVELIGRFHPRDTLREVFLWLLDQLKTRTNSDTTSEERVEEAMDLFELFVSPPKTLLLPLLPSKSKTKTSRRQWNEKDLLSLGLVPAAKLSLSWKRPLSEQETERGCYLRQELLAQITTTTNNNNDTNDNSATPSDISIPQGVSLQVLGNQSQSLLSPPFPPPSSQPFPAEKDRAKTKAKPKWFKL